MQGQQHKKRAATLCCTYFPSVESLQHSLCASPSLVGGNIDCNSGLVAHIDLCCCGVSAFPVSQCRGGLGDEAAYAIGNISPAQWSLARSCRIVTNESNKRDGGSRKASAPAVSGGVADKHRFRLKGTFWDEFHLHNGCMGMFDGVSSWTLGNCW